MSNVMFYVDTLLCSASDLRFEAPEILRPPTNDTRQHQKNARKMILVCLSLLARSLFLIIVSVIVISILEGKRSERKRNRYPGGRRRREEGER